MGQHFFGTSARRAAQGTIPGMTLGIVWILAPGAALADCTAIGGSAVCGGDVSHTEVGRRIVFPHGPAGERVGDYAVRPKGGLPQVLPKGGTAGPPASRPLDRSDGLTDPRRGADFGAFRFSAPAPSGLTSTGPLR